MKTRMVLATCGIVLNTLIAWPVLAQGPIPQPVSPADTQVREQKQVQKGESSRSATGNERPTKLYKKTKDGSNCIPGPGCINIPHDGYPRKDSRN